MPLNHVACSIKRTLYLLPRKQMQSVKTTKDMEKTLCYVAKAIYALLAHFVATTIYVLCPESFCA